MANWQAFTDLWNQGSFVSPVPAPNADPADTPTVCVQFNSAWLPYVLGSMFQLTQPSAWDPASPGYADVLAQAQALMAIFSGAEECTYMLQWNFTDTCILQYSVDGGVTWIDVPGWSTFAPTCFAGPPGPAGGYTPGTPGNPQGVTLAQQACNIASYLAADVLQTSMGQQVSNYNASKTLLESAIVLAGAIGFLDPIWEVAVAAFGILYNFYTVTTIGQFTSASTDATLLSDLQCAIYEAIRVDGLVDSANFATLVANVAAIMYTYPDVITALVAYLDALGVVGLQQLQLTGSLYIGDCSACSTPPGADVCAEMVNADGDQVQITTTMFTTLEPDFSLFFWMEYTGGAPGIVYPLAHANGASAGGWVLATDGVHGDALYFTPESLGNYDIGIALPTAKSSICLVRQSGVLSSYLDGVLVTSQACTTAALDGAGAAYFKIGVDIDTKIGNVRVYNAALTALEVATIYGLGSNPSGTSGDPAVANLTALWLLQEGTGATITDSSGNGSNGAFVGTGAHWSTW